MARNKNLGWQTMTPLQMIVGVIFPRRGGSEANSNADSHYPTARPEGSNCFLAGHHTRKTLLTRGTTHMGMVPNRSVPRLFLLVPDRDSAHEI
jgi:hypothetical protein